MRAALSQIARTGAPLAAAQLAQFAMALTDTFFLGTIGPEAVATGGLGVAFEFTTLVILQGVLAAVGVLVAQARGARRPADVPGLYSTGLLLTALLVLPALLVFANAGAIMRAVGEPEALAHDTARYLDILLFCTPGALLGGGLQRAFLPAIGAGAIIFPVTLAGTILNAILCPMLIHGGFGLPAMGYLGPALATAIVLNLVAAALLVFCHTGTRAAFTRMTRPRSHILRALLRLGLPIGGTYAVETTLFLAVALLIGHFGPDALAAQQVALTIISTAFMIPAGLAQAANVHVGYAVGANDPAAARQAGLAAIWLAAAFEACCAAFNLLAPGAVAGLFLTPGTPAFDIAATLLMIAAAFQVADGVQSTAAGALRGLGDTRVPFGLAALGYWAVGFPAAALLAFLTPLGPAGAWIGLAAALSLVALLLTTRFLSRVRSARPVPATP